MRDQNTPLALSIPEAAKLVGIGRTRLYEEISKGNLAVRKVGTRTIVTVRDLQTWLDSLPLGSR